MPAQTLEEAAEQAGLGPLPPALRNRRDIVPAAPPPPAPITDIAAALARYRRWGPEAEPVAVLRQHVEQRTVERHWLALDLADASLPRPAGWARNPLPFDRNLPALPQENLDVDVVLAAVDQLDLAALEILVQVPGGADLFPGESRSRFFEGALALGLARLGRWSWLRVCYALEPERAAPRLLDVRSPSTSGFAPSSALTVSCVVAWGSSRPTRRGRPWPATSRRSSSTTRTARGRGIRCACSARETTSPSSASR